MRTLALLAAAALVAALVAFAPHVSQAMFGPLRIGTPAASSGGGGSACGGEAAPSMAVAAGFTTCALNYDWTAATGANWLPANEAFSGPVSTVSNWLSCSISGSAAWNYTSGNNCGSFVFTTTDGGTQVLDVHYEPSYGSTNNQIENCTNGFSGPCPAGAAMPTGMLWEIKYRLAAYSGSSAQGGVYTWNYPSNGTVNAFNDDWFSNDNADTSRGTGGATSQPSNYYWAPYNSPYGCLLSPCTQNLPGGTGYQSTSYHVIDVLLTQGNPLTAYYGCAWVDGVFQSCDPGDNMLAANRVWFIIQLFDSSTPSSNTDLLLQYLRVWSCTAYATTECSGAVFNGGTSPGLAYYHN